jgi:hypothetical protein
MTNESQTAYLRGENLTADKIGIAATLFSLLFCIIVKKH